MKEIQHYDKAVHKFYNAKRFKTFPITSWDIFAEQFRIIGEGLNDIIKFTKLAKRNKWDTAVPFKSEVLDKNHTVVVTDTYLNIINVSQNIHQMNGYSSGDVIGKKPKMFQGELTCHETSLRIGQAVKEQIPFEETILNYRKDGSTYHCWIKGSPIKDVTGKVVNFIAFEKEIV